MDYDSRELYYKSIGQEAVGDKNSPFNVSAF